MFRWFRTVCLWPIGTYSNESIRRGRIAEKQSQVHYQRGQIHWTKRTATISSEVIWISTQNSNKHGKNTARRQNKTRCSHLTSSKICFPITLPPLHPMVIWWLREHLSFNPVPPLLSYPPNNLWTNIYNPLLSLTPWSLKKSPPSPQLACDTKITSFIKAHTHTHKT